MHCCHYVDPEYEEPYNSEIEWSENQERYLVLLYRQHPCLWDKSNSNYLDFYARRLAYETIHEQVEDMGVTLVDVVMKIREVRRTYVDELRQKAENKSIGCTYEPEQIWFNELHNFLFYQLHCDEIEIIEAISKDSYCSSNYCDEEGESYRSCARETLSDGGGLSEAIGMSKPSSCLSKPLMDPASTTETSLRHTNRSATAATTTTTTAVPLKNVIKSMTEDCCRRCRDKRSMVKFESEVNWNGCESKTATAVVVRRTKSNPEGGVACKTEKMVQPIRTDERSIAGTVGMEEEEVERQSSRQSCLTARKSSDQFDLFAKSIACQLRKMSSDTAAKVQMEIQKLLTNVPRESNVTITLVIPSKADLSVQDSKEYNCHITSIFPYSPDRNYVSQESNLTVRGLYSSETTV